MHVSKNLTGWMQIFLWGTKQALSAASWFLAVVYHVSRVGQ